MTVRNRAAREEDIEPALDLFVGTLRDMLARSGYPHVFRTDPTLF